MVKRDIGNELCIAVVDAEPTRVRVLLAEGADVNAVGNRRYAIVAHRTPLWLAVNIAGTINSELWAEMIQDLGRLRPAILNRDVQKRRQDFLQIIQILIQAKADLEARPFGTTPLWQAVHATDLELVEILLSHGANPNAESLSILSNHAKKERVKGPLGMMGYYDTVLHGAVEKNSVPIVEALLKAGADRTRIDHEGKTPLDCAHEKHFADIVALLEDSHHKV